MKTGLFHICTVALLGLFTYPATNSFAALIEAEEVKDTDKEMIDVRFDEALLSDQPVAIYEASLDIQEDPRNPDHWVKVGDIYLFSEKPAKAASAYWRAARLKPDHPLALQNLGVCFLNMKDYVRAQQVFEALLEKKPKNTAILLNAGAAYHGLGKYAEAEQAFQLVHEADPKNYNAIYNLATIKALIDQLPEAIELYKLAYEINPKSPFSLFAAARGHARLDQPEPMFKLLEKGLKQLPRDQAGIILGHPAFSPWSNTYEFRRLLTAEDR